MSINFLSFHNEIAINSWHMIWDLYFLNNLIMNQRKIFLACVKPEICRLIEKTLSNENYKMTCLCGSAVDKKSVQELNHEFDCIILDEELELEIRKAVTEKFSRLPIVCLPSLNFTGTISNQARYISEPLKLSELSKALKEIFNIK